ncbi:uncharacterized protein EV420DRAFT_1170963 [Desarmillaria tabescens]|uniref:F-box domain-containing protein n=1 Tax=Armillaria tabescens TaxID=1929756 RepID=A0AA39JCY2_ARMTA|nr:uncharacterized protein EV420DRAFT_1170963 [Desarmillaria tabescens]KAK0439511.1 hypothetical protein EV420DRAFT_1170963 [Desarmillaria tabescens]
MLLSVPNEILSKITFEADNRTRRRLRRTCKLLNNVATPLVFESVYIDLSWKRPSGSVLLFLKSLTSGPKLAQHIIRLSLYLPKRFRPTRSWFTSEAKIKKEEHRRDSFDQLFIEAIPSMVSLKSLTWRSSGDEGPSYAQLMFEHFGDLPLLSNLKISSHGTWDIPWSPFRHIRDLKYWGRGANELITFLGYNLHLESIDASVWRPLDLSFEDGLPISSLFRSLPPGTYSTVKTLRIGGVTFNQLYAHEIPDLIPHLRCLENLRVYIPIPNEFWDRLREDDIHLTSLSYCESNIDSALLSYLMSYTGLHELSLGIWDRPTPNSLHNADLLPNVIALSSWCLTKVHIEPDHSGAWCLDHRMLDALVICRGLKSLHVCADKVTTKVEVNNDRVLGALMVLWPNLWDLNINAVSPSFGFDAVRTAASQIHGRILAFRFAPLPPERARLHVSSDFATYSVKIHDQKNNTHSFKVRYLNYYGKKESSRKYKFWRRSDGTNDD